MKKLIFLLLFIILISSCTTTKYIEIPVENTRIEYRDRHTIDTIYKTDSTIIKDKGDTIYLEKYKYLYKVKEVRDTINITDTITVVNTVEVIKEVNKLKDWQIALMVIGGAAVAILIFKLKKL